MQQPLNSQSDSLKLKFNDLSSQESYSSPNEHLHIQNNQSKQTNHTSFPNLIQYLHFIKRNLHSFIKPHQQPYLHQIQTLFQNILPKNNTITVFSNQNILSKQNIFSNKNNKQQQQINLQQLKTFPQIYEFASTIHQQVNQIIGKKVLNSGKFRKSSHFTDKLIVTQISHSQNYEVVSLQLELLSFKTQIYILNQTQGSPIHIHGESHSSGAFADVYYADDHGNQIAIKCTSVIKGVQNSQNEPISKYKQNTFVNVLKQYLLLLLFSQLKIGPRFHQIGGFDLICYDECFQFAMQRVYSPKSFQATIDQMKDNLFEMHMLKIVHRDIKPIHIAYSNNYKKYVFLDFGSCEVINQKIGERTKTIYRGTISYSSQQVLQLLSKPNTYADLYDNDIYSLTKSFRQKTAEFFSFNKNSLTMNKFSKFKMITIKHQLYFSEFDQFYSLWIKVKEIFANDSQQIQEKILDFFSELCPNANYKKLSEFYFNEIDERIRELPKFNVYKSIFVRQINHLHYYLHQFSEKKQIKRNNQFLYETLALQNSQIEDFEKILRQTLNKKENMQSYLLRKLQESSVLSLKQILNQTQLFFVAVYYTCLTENPHKITIKDKIKVAQRVVKLIQRQSQYGNYHLNFIFKCDQQSLQQISIFYHYFLFKVWQHVPLNFKTQLAILSVSTICLLGYPANNKLSVSFMIYQLIKGHQHLNKTKQNYQNQKLKQHQIITQDNYKTHQNYSSNQLNEKIEFILIYWQCSLVFQIFGNIYHGATNTQIPNFIYDEKLFDQMENTTKNLMNFKSQEFSQFLNLNKKFNQFMIRQYLKLNQQKFNELLRLLKSSQIDKICKKNKKSKDGEIQFLTYQVKDLQTIISFMKNNILNDFLSDCKILPFYLYFIFNDLYRISSELSHVFHKIDGIVMIKSLFQKFEVHNRFKLFLMKKDFQGLKETTQLICKLIQKSTGQSEDIEFIFKILQIILDLFICDYLLQLPSFNQQSKSLFEYVYKIFNSSLQIGLKFIQKRDENSQKQEFFQILRQQKNYLNCIELALRKTVKFTGFISSLLKVGKFLWKLIQILSKNISLKKFKIIFETNDFLLLKKLHQSSYIYETAAQWIDYIKENPLIKKAFKQNRTLPVYLVGLLINHRRTQQQILRTQKMINQLFGGLFIEKYLCQNARDNLPSFRIAFDYMHINIMKTTYDPEQCSKLIDLFWVCCEKRFLNRFIFNRNFIRILFNSFIFARKSFQQLALFFCRLTNSIKQKPTKSIIVSFIKNLKSFFWCKCKGCFPRQPQGWNPNHFTEFLIQTIKSYKPSDNPYMSFVYLYSMTSKQPSRGLIKIIVKFILKSIPYLDLVAKQIIQARIYFYIYLGFTPQPYNTLIFLGDHTKQLSIGTISRDQVKEKSYRRLFYFYLKIKRHQEKTQDNLQDLIDKMFCKQVYIRGYVYPSKVKEIYRKKLRRYFGLKQNYMKKAQMMELDNFIRNPELSQF